MKNIRCLFFFSYFTASDVASFDGSSSLIYRLSVWPSPTGKEVISLKFKTLKNSGTLLHAEGHSDHSLTLVLEKGRLLLYHQQGAQHRSAHNQIRFYLLGRSGHILQQHSAMQRQSKTYRQNNWGVKKYVYIYIYIITYNFSLKGS